MVFLAGVFVAAAAAADPPPTPAPQPEAAKRPFSLNLDQLVDLDHDRGHSEFNVTMRREMWNDPMVRLAFAVSREEAAARRGGMLGFDAPFTAGSLVMNMPAADFRLVLKGPWAEDWHDLSTGEKIGRVTETAVTYGILLEILRALH